MFEERKELIKKLETERNGKVLLYITGDRPGLTTNITDQRCYEDFKLETVDLLKINLKENGVTIQKTEELLENVFHKIFYSQGLEFANFIKQKALKIS